jgi:hypothetical protein
VPGDGGLTEGTVCAVVGLWLGPVAVPGDGGLTEATVCAVVVLWLGPVAVLDDDGLVDRTACESVADGAGTRLSAVVVVVLPEDGSAAPRAVGALLAPRCMAAGSAKGVMADDVGASGMGGGVVGCG